jgi:hypothetical protein
VRLRARLDAVEKRQFLTLTGLDLRPLSRPARSQSLYRLRSLGSCTQRPDIMTIVFLARVRKNAILVLMAVGNKEVQWWDSLQRSNEYYTKIHGRT